jgi:hypothetical protein
MRTPRDPHTENSAICICIICTNGESVDIFDASMLCAAYQKLSGIICLDAGVEVLRRRRAVNHYIRPKLGTIQRQLKHRLVAKGTPLV